MSELKFNEKVLSKNMPQLNFFMTVVIGCNIFYGFGILKEEKKGIFPDIRLREK